MAAVLGTGPCLEEAFLYPATAEWFASTLLAMADVCVGSVLGTIFFEVIISEDARSACIHFGEAGLP